MVKAGRNDERDPHKTTEQTVPKMDGESRKDVSAHGWGKSAK